MKPHKNSRTSCAGAPRRPQEAAFFPLAQLGLARAYVVRGDKAKARTLYRDLFAIWKDADPDLPAAGQGGLREVRCAGSIR